MVILLQLVIFLIAFTIRGRFLTGRHLDGGSKAVGVITHSGKRTFHHGIIHETGLPFIIKHERWYHKLLKMIGIASELHLNNESFDKKYFIITDSPAHLERALHSNNLAAHVDRLLSLDVKSLRSSGDRIWCVLNKKGVKQRYTQIKERTELLKKIAEDTKASAASGIQPNWRPRYYALLIVSIHAALLTYGLFGFIPTLSDPIKTTDPDMVRRGFHAGGVVAALWLFLVVYFYRGTSWVCWLITDFLLCGLLGFMLSGINVTREINIHFPQVTQVYSQPVIAKICKLECYNRYRRRHRSYRAYSYRTEEQCSPVGRAWIIEHKKKVDSVCRSSAEFSYSIDIAHWKRRENYNIDVSGQFFDMVKVGDRLSVPVHEGALHFQWLDVSKITYSKSSGDIHQ